MLAAEVKSMRKRGASWKIISCFVGMSLKSLMKFVNKNGLNDNNRNYQDEHDTRKKCQALAEREGFSSMKDAIRHHRLSGMTYRGVANHFGIAESTMRYHYPKDIKGDIWIFSDAKKKSAMKNIRKAQDETRKRVTEGRHHWQNFGKDERT